MSAFSSVLRSDSGSGFAAGFGAFLMWGSLVLYWHPLTGIPATEILAHRIFWSLLTILPIIWYTHRFPEVRAALRSPATMLRITASALIIACNWCLYIWGVTHGRVLESSLGYYINPLANVLMGFLFLGERPTRLQWAAIVLAAVGVLWSVVSYGHAPWLGLSLALTFSLYGLCRKTVRVESAPGLLLETVILAPAACIGLLWLHFRGLGHLSTSDPVTMLLLMGSGLVTSVPLLLFAYAARHMRLMTLGLLQYISPTLTFLLGAFVFHEPVRPTAMVTFGCIWSALAVYTWSGLRALRSR